MTKKNPPKAVKVSAPAKIILSGEHAVVYGKPALLAAVNLRLNLRLEENKGGDLINSPEPHGLVSYGFKKLKSFFKLNHTFLKADIDSQIPIGCGMGSSAALSVALSAAFRKFSGQSWNLKKTNDLAYQIEKKQHGNPSGCDNTVSTYGGLLYFQRLENQIKLSPLKVKSFPDLYAINTGRPKESTGEMVSLVKELLFKTPRRTKKILREIEEVTRGILEILTGQERFSLTELLKENEALLERIGVVSPLAVRIVRKIEKMKGAAKVSGAGGANGGAGIIIVHHHQPEAVRWFAKEEGLDFYHLKLSREGVKDERN